MLRAADKDSRRLDKTKKACDEKLDWDPNTSVLIAACTAGERAKEGDFDGKAQGYFTRAFLRVLRDGTHKNKTYTDIGAEITKLIPSYKGSHVQNPLVLGERQHLIDRDLRTEWTLGEAQEAAQNASVAWDGRRQAE